jgi:prepilin-type N-terminal cleavage/methylation domain-containing protein
LRPRHKELFMTGAGGSIVRELRDERGFTLLETILTMVILVVILGIVLSAMRIGIRSWEKGEAAAEDAASIRAITSRLSKEIGSAYPYKDRTDGAVRVLFTGGPGALGFVTVSQGLPGLPWGGAKWVYYSVRDGVFTVREKTVPAAGALKDEGGRLNELDRDVAAVSFEYLGADGWEKSWDAEDKKALPASVRVSISFSDGRKAVTETALPGLTGHGPKEQAPPGPEA